MQPLLPLGCVGLTSITPITKLRTQGLRPLLGIELDTIRSLNLTHARRHTHYYIYYYNYMLNDTCYQLFLHVVSFKGRYIKDLCCSRTFWQGAFGNRSKSTLRWPNIRFLAAICIFRLKIFFGHLHRYNIII